MFSSSWTSVGVFAVSLVATLLWSWHPSLWTDEAATISAAQRTLPQLVAMAHNIDAVHATYYALMHGWLQIVPPTPFLLRLPSALAAALTVLLTLWIGRRLATPQVALAGALVLAILPRTTWMGMEARPYAFSALLAVAATLALVVLVTAEPIGRRRVLVLVGYALLVALGIAINIYLALLLVAHGCTLLVSRAVDWRLRWSWLVASLVGVALSTPVVWTATHQRDQLGGGAFGIGQWIQNVVVSQWFLGETPTPSTGSGGTGLSLAWGSLWKLAAIALALLCWALVVVGLLSRRRRLPVLLWTLPWVAVPTLAIGLYSIGVRDLYNARYFTFATPAVGLLIGHGLAQLRRRWLQVAAVVLIALCALPVYVSQRTAYAKSSTDWSGVARFVADHRGDVPVDREAVYFSPRYPIVGTTVGQTARGVRVAYPAPFAGMADVTLLRTPVQDNNLSGTSRLLVDSQSELAGADVVWVVRRNDYAYSAADDQTLRAAGLRPARQWVGPLDRVVEFSRG